MNWAGILLAYISLFVFGLSDNMRGPLYPEILKTFGVSHSEASLFFSVASFVSFLGAWSAPKIIARWGHISAVRLGLALVSLSYLGYYLVTSFPIMLGVSAIFGFAIGLLGVTQNLLVLLASNLKFRSRVQSGLHACYGASSLLAPLVVLIVAALSLHWQISFLVPSVLCALVLAGTYLFPQMRGALHAVRGSEETAKHASVQSSSPERIYWSVVLALYVALEILLSSRLALFLREGREFTLESSSFWLMSFFAGLFLGRVFFAFVHLPVRFSVQMCGLMVLSAASFALGLWGRPEWMAVVGFTIAGFYPLWMSTLEPLFGGKMEEVASRGIGLTGFSVVAMHSVVGFFSDKAGVTAGMSVGLVLIGLLFVMVALFQVIFRRSLP